MQILVEIEVDPPAELRDPEGARRSQLLAADATDRREAITSLPLSSWTRVAVTPPAEAGA